MISSQENLGEDSDAGSEYSRKSFQGENHSFDYPYNIRSLGIEESEISSSIESGLVTEQHLNDISNELGLIRLCWENVPQVDFDDRLHYPLSYLTNNKKEKLLLWYSENFRQQFGFKYPNRRPLLIACNNECGIQKMVCTTIRPTKMKYPEFQTWKGCASFVAEHLTYEELENPTVLPYNLNSPQTVLRRQAGHSFEYSTLLASFLIASAYDAYVVSGYASREICRKDQTRIECPFLPDGFIEEEEEEEVEDPKYFLRKPRELESQFLAEMDAREQQKEKEAQKVQELAEMAAIKEYEKPWPDELWTWRLHSWVVILPSKDVVEPFFIESSTGIAKSLDDPDYHGIESIWNHQNYWVLVQFPGKTETCQDITFNLKNTSLWERLLIGEPFTSRQFPRALLEGETDEFQLACIEAEKHLDMPSSWVEILVIPEFVYERRYPDAKKTVYYLKAVSEQFAPYSFSDGLRERVTRYNDYECTDPREVRERYENRSDHLYFCQRKIGENSIFEKFKRGREDALKEHLYYSMDTGIEVKFKLVFYHDARLDGLSKLIMDPLFMTLYFEGRDDFLHYVHVDFAERVTRDQPLRHIIKITERYYRNPEKEADKDVAVVQFLFQERKLAMKFHYEPDHLTQTSRIFCKPAFAGRGGRLTYDPSLTSGYLTGPNTPPPKPLFIYKLEVEYFKQEELAERKIRERENELLFLLRLRAQELATSTLLVSEFDLERNAEAKKAFKDKEQQLKDSEKRDLNLECDFLAPYYAKLGISSNTVLPKRLALSVIIDCLEDWKNLLVARANNIQQQFEQTCQDFYDKNNWYEKNQSTISKEQEEEYFEYCKVNSFYLHILEVRLNRLKEVAPKRYMAIDAYLKADPRLAKRSARGR